MSEIMNRAEVTVDLFDVYGKRIHDKVDLVFQNTDVSTFSETYSVTLKGQPEVIPDVPAAPAGHADVTIKPTKYQERKIKVFVTGLTQNRISEVFFVNPAKADPKRISYSDLAAKTYAIDLKRILDNSEPKIEASNWNDLDPLNRATILNLCSKMAREHLVDGSPVIKQVQGIDQTRLSPDFRERIYGPVLGGFLAGLQALPKNFKTAKGSLHHFPNGWVPVTGEHGSFKTKDKAGNIQFTFARGEEGRSYCDIDLDDHSGWQHVRDYLEHKITDEETHPYNIHQILVRFQKGGDPEYDLL